MQKDEMEGTYSTYGGEWRWRCIQGFVWRNVRERAHMEDPGVGGRIFKK